MRDIATGDPVDLHLLPALAAPDEERAWMAARGRLAALWHEQLPPLLDYGYVEGRARFEAYGEWPQRRAPAPAAPAALVTFLAECGLADPAVRTPVDGSAGSGSRAIVGVRIAEPPALAAVLDVLDGSGDGAPVRLSCAAPPGSGWRTFARLAARESRRRGFIPVDVRVLRQRPDLAAVLRGRHALLIDAGTGPAGEAERALLALAIASARGHVLLVRCRETRRGTVLRLAPFDPAVLAQRIHLYPPHPRHRRRLERAAAQHGGLPGRLIASLCGEPSSPAHAGLRVAEARASYHAPPPIVAVPPADVETRAQTDRCLSQAARLAARGRHAAAERLLRETAAAVARRHHRDSAARLDVGRGWLLLGRGRPSSARPLFHQAHGALEACDDAGAREAAGGLAAAHVLEGELEAAEAILRAAVAHAGAAAISEGESGGRRSELWLARCLYWQGRLEAAERSLAPSLECDDPAARAVALGLLARVALARHDLPDAGRAAALALSEMHLQAQPDTASAAHEVLLMAQGRIGDAAAVALHARQALEWGARAHRPLRVIHARAAIADAWHLCGERVEGRLIGRLARGADSALPALTRHRLAAVLARVHPDARQREKYAARVARFVRATGARVLLPDAFDPPGARLARDTAALLQISEGAREGKGAAHRICAWLRGRTDARAVAVVDSQGNVVAAAGEGTRSASVARVLATRQSQPPWVYPEGLEAAAPIVHEGSVLGVLAARWMVTQEVEAGVTALLSAAASCLAAALRSRQDRIEIGAPEDDSRAPIVGRSPAIARLRDAIARAAPSPFPVLIAGESGAGKELVGRAIHAGSPRRGRPFCAVNCAALMEDLLEAELFGHARGAFTGAHADRPGLFEQADGGTLFLDEVSELSPRAQAKLLRVLQEGEIRRVGENLVRRVDVRMVAASNRVLDADAASGRFRRDLLFRLAVVRLVVPPLRERREDIALLATRFWQEAAARAGSRATLTADAIGALTRYDWPGNVRELQNVMAALAVHVPRGRVAASDVAALTGGPPPAPARTLEEARRAFDRQFVEAAIARSGGRHGDAARTLGLTRQGLAKLLRRLAATAGPDSLIESA